jgi:hypothetical protein
VLQRRTELLLGDGVVVGSLVAKKVVVGMVVLFSTISYLQYHRRRDSTYPAGVWSIVSLRVLLRWSSLWGITTSIPWIVAPILVCRLGLGH